MRLQCIVTIWLNTSPNFLTYLLGGAWGTAGHTPPTFINYHRYISRGFEAVLFTGWMRFVSPKQQHQSSEGLKQENKH